MFKVIKNVATFVCLSLLLTSCAKECLVRNNDFCLRYVLVVDYENVEYGSEARRAIDENNRNYFCECMDTTEEERSLFCEV